MDLLSYIIGKRSCKSDSDDRYDEGVADGKKAEYDRFWDVIQQNGERTNYINMFSNRGWTRETFKPKYAICPQSANAIFNTFGTGDLIDLRQSCVLDFSNCEQASNAFHSSNILAVGVIDLKTTVSTSPSAIPRNLFRRADRLEIIEKIIYYKDVNYNMTV